MYCLYYFFPVLLRQGRNGEHWIHGATGISSGKATLLLVICVPNRGDMEIVCHAGHSRTARGLIAGTVSFNCYLHSAS